MRPPQGGVENLTHTISENGSRTMSYSYKGENYFTTYSPASQGKDCYSFKQKKPSVMVAKFKQVHFVEVRTKSPYSYSH
ncbi:hypothetical protein [Pseudoalteromonas sp. LC2018020214]|uniref:hypothetical protein n=1 Tax=Pseudoalteromonas sp. LC2018020214 TaxID=2799564 RepID=UPI001F46DF9D|nr:hypothetical protein [Pseudoalteromonas sp. LC2018020214]